MARDAATGACTAQEVGRAVWSAARTTHVVALDVVTVERTTQVEEREFAGDKRFGGSGFTDTELEVGRAVERLSQDWGLQPYQVSLAWLLSRPAVASVIVGAESVEEITANATEADVKLEQAQLDALTALRAGDDDS